MLVTRLLLLMAVSGARLLLSRQPGKAARAGRVCWGRGGGSVRSIRSALDGRRTAAGGGERGDVPGWVLITVMTAGLVTVLWQLAGPKLSDMLDSALSSVTGG